ATLIKRLATAEHDRDEALARAGGPGRAPVQVAPAAPEPGREQVGERNTGGLSALLNLWNTAVLKRPAPRKETVETPPEMGFGKILEIEVLRGEAPSPAPRDDAKDRPEPVSSQRPPGPVFGIEEIHDPAPLSKGPAAAEPAPESRRPDRPGGAAPPRPNPTRRPAPKPAPPPPARDGTEGLGGWLRNLGNRMRHKK
ncbi:MAG: hypothetical protein ABI565_07400, partial [Vicinamibacteria bacterium]